MRAVLSLFVLLFGLVLESSLSGQTLEWLFNPQEALALAYQTEKPLLLLWDGSQGGFAAAAEGLFSNWPFWTQKAASFLVPCKVVLRGATLPAEIQSALPAAISAGGSGFLLLWDSRGKRPAAVWNELPSILEFSKALEKTTDSKLPPPYTLSVASFRYGRTVFKRIDNGPGWVANSESGETLWQEEGPVGGLVILKKKPGMERIALPLQDGWCFLQGPDQSWTALAYGSVD